MGWFYDPEGIFTSWQGKYPERIQALPKKPVSWTPLLGPVSILNVEVVMVWDGPPAPFPKRPTADEFAEGVEIAIRIMQTVGPDENQQLRSHIWEAASELGLWEVLPGHE